MKYAKLKLEPVIDTPETLEVLKAAKVAITMQKFSVGEPVSFTFPPKAAHTARTLILILWKDYLRILLPTKTEEEATYCLRNFSERLNFYQREIQKFKPVDRKERLFPLKDYDKFIWKVHKKRGSPSKNITNSTPNFVNKGTDSYYWRSINYYIYKAPDGKVMFNCSSRKRRNLL